MPSSIDYAALEAAALTAIYEGSMDIIEANLHSITKQVLEKAILVYFAKNDELTAALSESASWFAANKSYWLASELAKLITNEQGNRVTFAQFSKAAEPVLGKYNQKWLRTEYNTAIRAARTASNYEKYLKDADLYPNLTYTRSRAASPRESHLMYVGITRPINDAFWTDHMPPLDWNCLCSVKQSSSQVTDLKEDMPKPASGLGHNVYKTRELFGSSHPYFRRMPKSKREPIRQWVKENG